MEFTAQGVLVRARSCCAHRRHPEAVFGIVRHSMAAPLRFFTAPGHLTVSRDPFKVGSVETIHFISREAP